jgi:hypothetical protein
LAAGGLGPSPGRRHQEQGQKADGDGKLSEAEGCQGVIKRQG